MVSNPDLKEFVPNANAKEFVPASLRAPGFCSPPGLTTSPGLLGEGEVEDLSSEEEEMAPPPGLEVVAPGLQLANKSGPDLEEDNKRLAEENLRLSNQCIKMETARLAKENELLRRQLTANASKWNQLAATSSASGPPGVFLLPVVVQDGPPGVFLPTPTSDQWTFTSAPSAPPGVWAQPGFEGLTCETSHRHRIHSAVTTVGDDAESVHSEGPHGDDAASDDCEHSTQAVSASEDSEKLSSVPSRRTSSFSEDPAAGRDRATTAPPALSGDFGLEAHSWPSLRA